MIEKPVLYCCTVCGEWNKVREGVEPIGTYIATGVFGKGYDVNQGILCPACMQKFDLKVSSGS